MSINNPTVTDAITSLVPGAQVFVYGDNTNYQVTWNSPSVAPVTKEQIDAELARLEAQVPLINCKLQAKTILSATDWTTIPDIALPENNPYLTNQSEFIAYRNIIRNYAVNPVANPVWPTPPTEQWSA